MFVFHADGLFLGVFCFVIFGGCKGLCFAWLTAGPVCLCFMLVGFFGACFVLCFLEAARGPALHDLQQDQCVCLWQLFSVIANHRHCKEI